MGATDFSKIIFVDQSAKEAFDAITNVRAWWSEDIDGGSAKLGDQFDYRYKDVHQCRIKVVEFNRDKKLVWNVVDNYFSFIKDQSEWKGTKISFEIFGRDLQTEIRFTHFGLVPAYECYEICRDAWTNYIDKSLRNLIVSGKGEPNPKEGGFNEWLLHEHNLG